VLVFFGRAVLLAPTTTVVGDAGADKTIPMWSFVWWPHALGQGHDPFSANVVWVPKGIDLAWVTAVPGPSVIAYPLTALIGPVATYNVLALAAPALAAWTMYLLANWITRAFWPSVAAGWIFGFSAYEVGHLAGHLNLVLIFLAPICVLLVLRHLAGEITTRRLAPLFGLALAGQVLISTEIALTLLLAGLLFALLALWRLDAMRSALLRTLVGSGYGVLVAAVLVSPLLVHAFLLAGRDNAPLRSPFSEATDLLNYLVPTRRIWLHFPGSRAVTDRFTATGAERGGYLGLPLLVMVGSFAFMKRRHTAHAILLLGFTALVLATLGPEFRVDGHGISPGPWKLPAKLPITETILPARLTMYVALVVAIIAAIWLSEGDRGKRRRWAIVLLGIALALPDPANSLWKSHAPNPRFFSTGTYRRYLHRDEAVLVLPYAGSGWSLLWQAETNMAFRLVGGHLGRKVTPAEKRWSSIYAALGSGPVSPRIATRFRQFLVAHDVGAIIVAPGTKARVRRLIETLGVEPARAADVLVYRL
jgi:hypothetical protein